MYCPECKTNLDDTPVTMPCQTCGGLRRSAVAAPCVAPATVAIPPSRVIAESNYPDGSKELAFGSPDFRSTTSSSSLGKPAHMFSGLPVCGESDALQVCEVLQEALKRRGITLSGKFRTPTGLEGGIDAEGEIPDGSVISVQVTGVIDRKRWLN